MQKGVFITFEGPDGAGKTAVQAGAYKCLLEQGINVVLTREPGGIDIAEQIRHIVLNPKNTAMDARTEALLYAAARRQHLAEKVIPLLDQGKHVLCDRFVDSSLAYQGQGRRIGIEEILQINQFAIQETMPDLTIFLMIEPELGLERIAQSRNESEVDRLDMEKLSFHQEVYKGYQILAKMYPDRIKTIDASRSYDVVLAETVSILTTFMKNKV